MRKINPLISYRLAYPVVPTVVTSKYRNSTVAMPAISYTMVSNKPPIMGLCIKATHTTYKIIKKSKRMAFIWLDKDYYYIIDRLVSVHGYEEKDKLKKAEINYYLSNKLKLPIPENAVAYIEARLINEIKIGDHILLLSDVVSAFAIEDFDNYWKFDKYKPILYTGMQDKLQLYAPK
ncbi:MAG: flavin reductase family protein [Conexivisphaerales archaeon]